MYIYCHVVISYIVYLLYLYHTIYRVLYWEKDEVLSKTYLI